MTTGDLVECSLVGDDMKLEAVKRSTLMWSEAVLGRNASLIAITTESALPELVDAIKAAYLHLEKNYREPIRRALSGKDPFPRAG